MLRGTTQWAQIHGRRECTDADVAAILVEISDQCGGATLHRITSSNTRGEEYLEAAGRNSMLEPEDMAVDENAGEVGGAHAADVVRLVTMNVAGLCDDLRPAGARMDEILTKLLTDEEPDVLCFQEVVDDMYEVLRSRTSAAGDMREWSLHRRRDTETNYYVVTAAKYARLEGERATSKRLESKQGRHALTLTRQGMHFITVHAESGGDAAERDCRALQLQYLARAHERADGCACFLAGDFNLRQGEDQVLLDEGWRDVGRSDDWTWARGEFRARYDRVYIHAGVAKLAKVPHTHLKVIATPKECQEATKQRPEAPRSSLIYRARDLDPKPQDRELKPQDLLELNASFVMQASTKSLTACGV